MSEAGATGLAVIRRALLPLVVSAGLLLGGTAYGRAASSALTTTPRLGPVEHVTADGLSFGYRTGGSGTPLIMVMGRSGTMAEWDPQLINQLIRNHHVVIFDNRGMGTTSSGYSPTDVTVPLMAKDTLALASALHIRRFDIMGWSMGGEISQQVTVDAPGRVLKVVLCATSAGGPTEQLPSQPVQTIMSEPDLPAPVLLGLSFPPTAAGVKGEFDYAARVAAQYHMITCPATASRPAPTAPKVRPTPASNGPPPPAASTTTYPSSISTCWSCGATST